MKRKRVCVIIETKKGILVARHFMNRRYALLGGGLKKGENPENAISREIKEETGLNLFGVKFLFELDTFFQKHIVFIGKVKGKLKLNWEIKELGYALDGILLNSTTRKIIEKWKNL